MQLQNQLLIAMPNMDDDYFRHSVIYICEHSKRGSMGLVLNKPTDLSIAEMVAKLNFMMANDRGYPQNYVLAGGPVSVEHGFILHTKTKRKFMHSYKISERLQLTTSADVVDSFATEQSPEKYLVTIGCASWSANQLEQEILQNMWLINEADESIIFDLPYEQRWSMALQKLGIDSHNLVTQAGHC